MHYWGDDWPYWNDLGEAVEYVYSYCVKYARLGGSAKEKYGTLRFYAQFHHSLHDLFWPGHAYIRWHHPYCWKFPRLQPILGPVLRFIDSRIYRRLGPVRRLIRWYQSRIYVRAYKNAVKKWPHIREEILLDADFPEIKGFPKEENHAN